MHHYTDRHRLLHPIRAKESPALPTQDDKAAGRPSNPHHNLIQDIKHFKQASAINIKDEDKVGGE